MKKLAVLCLFVLCGIILINQTSCNSCSRKFGGTTNIKLELNEKFINVTWKESNIWVLTQDKNDAKTFNFKEYSNYGVLEGKVTIKEQ